MHFILASGTRSKLKFDTLDSFCTKISLTDKRINISQKKTDVTFKNGKIDKCIVKYPTLALEG